MTRKELLTASAEGGMWVGLRRHFVSRDCLYFKVEVEFKAVGRPERSEWEHHSPKTNEMSSSASPAVYSASHNR
jgi:hypothetical protein